MKWIFNQGSSETDVDDLIYGDDRAISQRFHVELSLEMPS